MTFNLSKPNLQDAPTEISEIVVDTGGIGVSFTFFAPTPT